jgi:uncharacterized membrane protein
VSYDFPVIDQYITDLTGTKSFSFNYGNIFTILLGGALAYGGAVFSVNFIRGNNPDLESVFFGFKNTNRFFVLLASNILIGVICLKLSILFIVPGIIAALALSMTFFILVDNPELSSLDAMKQSRALMEGHKWQLFKLYLRFIALGLLCLLTLGIGFIWLIPYANICTAQFYDSLLED